MMSPHSIESLLERQPKGSPLLQGFYSDPEIFERDIERIHLRHWLCVGHQSRARKPGDWFRFDIAGESIIVVRGRDDLLRALVNVCRHRGSRVCYEAEGSARMLVCPYHAWTYDLDGRLRTARQMGPNFNVSGQALPELHLRVLEGLIVVCLAPDPPGLESAERMLSASLTTQPKSPTTRSRNFARARPTARRKWVSKSRWFSTGRSPAHPIRRWRTARTTRPSPGR